MTMSRVGCGAIVLLASTPITAPGWPNESGDWWPHLDLAYVPAGLCTVTCSRLSSDVLRDICAGTATQGQGAGAG